MTVFETAVYLANELTDKHTLCSRNILYCSSNDHISYYGSHRLQIRARNSCKENDKINKGPYKSYNAYGRITI